MSTKTRRKILRKSDASADGNVEPVVLIPITCPKCRTHALVDVPALVVTIALNRWNRMRLHALCHPVSWDASPDELRQIRDYLGTEWQPEQCSQETRQASR